MRGITKNLVCVPPDYAILPQRYNNKQPSIHRSTIDMSQEQEMMLFFYIPDPQSIPSSLSSLWLIGAFFFGISSVDLLELDLLDFDEEWECFFLSSPFLSLSFLCFSFLSFELPSDACFLSDFWLWSDSFDDECFSLDLSLLESSLLDLSLLDLSLLDLSLLDLSLLDLSLLDLSLLEELCLLLLLSLDLWFSLDNSLFDDFSFVFSAFSFGLVSFSNALECFSEEFLCLSALLELSFLELLCLLEDSLFLSFSIDLWLDFSFLLEELSLSLVLDCLCELLNFSSGGFSNFVDSERCFECFSDESCRFSDAESLLRSLWLLCEVCLEEFVDFTCSCFSSFILWCVGFLSSSELCDVSDSLLSLWELSVSCVSLSLDSLLTCFLLHLSSLVLECFDFFVSGSSSCNNVV